MKNSNLTYVGSFSGTSKKGNDFTVAHFIGESDRKGVTGYDVYDFFLDTADIPKVTSLKPLQKVNVDYVYANGGNIMISMKVL